MSALAKLYASRGVSIGTNGIPERARRESSLPFSVASSTSQPARLEAVTSPTPDPRSSNGGAGADDTHVSDYTAALDVLESVNSGFADIFDRFQKSEAVKEQLAAECNQQEKEIDRLNADMDQLKQHLGELEAQNSEIAERLISEAARSAMADERAESAHQSLADAEKRIAELEKVCRTLHDGIYSVFGMGSPTQAVLQSLERYR